MRMHRKAIHLTGVDNEVTPASQEDVRGPKVFLSPGSKMTIDCPFTFHFDIGDALISSTTGVTRVIDGRGIHDGKRFYFCVFNGGQSCCAFYEFHLKRLIRNKKLILVSKVHPTCVA